MERPASTADATDIINVQDDHAEICEGLRLELSSDEKDRLEQQKTANAEAYEEYLRGRDSLGRYIYHTIARKDIDEAIERFERAAEMDPSFALAHSALGAAYASRVMKGFGEADDHLAAHEAFDKALALDPHLLEARLNMIFIYLSRGEKAKARSAVDELRREAPNDASVHFVRAVVARLDGDYEKALRSLDRMLKLNPSERVVLSYNRSRISRICRALMRRFAELAPRRSRARSSADKNVSCARAVLPRRADQAQRSLKQFSNAPALDASVRSMRRS